jgi:hypothetical protein
MVRADYRDMNDDEKIVAKGYNQGQIIVLILAVIPGVALWYGDDKAAAYLGFIVIVYLLNDAVGRLYDLTIRLSRTNELLVDGHDERRGRKAVM